MPLSFDTAVTTFWWGVACLNLSFLRRSWSLQGLFGVFVLWFACFPVFGQPQPCVALPRG